MKRMISDSERAQNRERERERDLAEEFSLDLTVYFWGLAKRRKWGGRRCPAQQHGISSAGWKGKFNFAHVFTLFEVMRGEEVQLQGGNKYSSMKKIVLKLY